MGIFNSKTQCYYCPGNVNHSLYEHVCAVCGAIGVHAEWHHKGCSYCIADHKTEDHICQSCGKKGHSERQHLCEYCTGLHRSCSHKCTICGEKGHEKILEEHLKCDLCDGKKQYTHSINGHIEALGINNIKLEVLDQFKYCEYCNEIVYIIDQCCRQCEKEISYMLTCHKCDLKFRNGYVHYCYNCGTSIKN